MSWRPQSRPLPRLAGAVIAIVGLSLLAPATLALERNGPVVEICADTMAYSAKVGKAERKQREEEARQEALTLLSLQLWNDAFGKPGATWSGFDPELSEADKIMATLLSRYRVRQRLEGGNYRYTGDKHAKQVSYCVADAEYRKVLEKVKRERELKVESLQSRFVELEGLMNDGRLEDASTKLTTLEIEVINEALEETEYQSRVNDVKQPFYRWLRAWGSEVTKGPDYVAYMINRAQELMDEGYLDEADRYVQQAVDADRNNVAARELRKQIHERRVERVDLVQEARRLAENGRFKAAQDQLEEARELGRDDPVLLETAEKNIEGMRAAYLELNPPRHVMVYLSLGTLGADKKAIEDRVSAVNGFPSDASTPIGFGAGANFRFGRWTLVSTTGSWGFSQDRNTIAGQVPLELFETFQLTGSAGFRSTRTPKRKVVYQLLGGVVWEKVDVNTLFSTPLDSSDSQVAWFARFAIEMKSAEFFIQQGFGFEDDPASLVGWSNNLQIGIAALF